MMTRPLHVVCIGDYPQQVSQVRGGVEAVVRYLTQAMQHRPGLKLEVVTLTRPARTASTVQHDQVTVHYVPASRRPSRLSVAENVERLCAILVHLQPDLVHAHIASEYALAAAASGRPWLLTLHGIRYLEAALRPGLLNRYRGWFTKRDEVRIVRSAPHLISISPFVEQTFAQVIRGPVYTIENPVAEAFFTLAPQPQRYQLLYAGRLIPRKDLVTLLQAFAQVLQQAPTATLRLAGGYPEHPEGVAYYQQLRAFVQQAGLTHAVTFLGELDEAALHREYAQCQALVLASTLETAPMVVMQAMAAGKAVVSTDAGGVRYLVEEGGSGFVVPIGQPAALATALLQLLNNEARTAQMAQRGRALATTRFRASVVAERTCAVYEEILGKQ